MASSDISHVAQNTSPSASRRGGTGGGAAGVTAMLSIFLLLLAFFLMLNSLARFETTKTRAVLGSLNATFNISNPTGREHEFGSFVGKVGASERLHAEAGELLRTLFGVDQYKLIRFGNVIVVDLENRGLFAEGATPKPKLLVFASRLGGSVLPPPPGVKIITEVTVRYGAETLKNVEPDTLALATRRAGAVIRAFERTGFDEKLLTTGVSAGDPRRIRIEFRVIDTPFAPLKAAQ